MSFNSTAIGLRVKDGVVLAVEKLVQSKLLVEGANRRIQSADLHIGIVSYFFLNDCKEKENLHFFFHLGHSRFIS